MCSRQFAPSPSTRAVLLLVFAATVFVRAQERIDLMMRDTAASLVFDSGALVVDSVNSDGPCRLLDRPGG